IRTCPSLSRATRSRSMMSRLPMITRSMLLRTASANDCTLRTARETDSSGMSHISNLSIVLRPERYFSEENFRSYLSTQTANAPLGASFAQAVCKEVSPQRKTNTKGFYFKRSHLKREHVPLTGDLLNRLFQKVTLLGGKNRRKKGERATSALIMRFVE